MPKKKEVKKRVTTKKTTGRPKKWTAEKIEEERLAMIDWFYNGKKNYSLTKFANSRGYNRQQLVYFKADSPAFLDSYKICKEMCENRTIEFSFENKMNPTIGIFLLKCNYGYIEEAEKQKIALRRDEIKVKSDDTGNVIHVHLSDIPDSPLVPAKDTK